jgi:DNA polymerase III delta subunit
MVHLFVGGDPLSKDIKLAKIKEEFLTPDTQDFNLDVIYAKETNLRSLQEKILTLPVKAKKRIVVVKDAQYLKDDLREFILEFAGQKKSSTILILDIAQLNRRDEFVNRISRYAEVSRFRDTLKPDAFSLSRQIEARRLDYALRTLNQLLEDGEKPERIIGGLRYAWAKGNVYSAEAKKKIKALLNCDIDIKTGRLRPDFALEKLVIRLCSLGSS